MVEWLYENQYGGLFLQWRHLGDREWLLELGERLREMTDEAPPPFLGTDEEGGIVSDLAGGRHQEHHVLHGWTWLRRGSVGNDEAVGIREPDGVHGTV